jgi:tRNA-dihydrouridine synthase B
MELLTLQSFRKVESEKSSSIVNLEKRNPLFFINKIPIYSRVTLSPMATISDSPYRFITRAMGSAWSFSEFVAAEQINLGNPKSLRMFDYHESERPVVFQIFGNSVESLSNAAQRILPLEPDIIDLNMGCSVQKVSQNGSGAGLLKNLSLAGKIIESLNKVTSKPITAKIRLGWNNESLNYKETIKVLQESGISAISVHGRTKEMGYKGIANWDAITEIKSIAKVPIFGNGDISTIQSIEQRLKESKVDAVLIGRGAIGNPWIFSGIDKGSLSISEVHKVAFNHYLSMKEFYGLESYTLFKKFFTKYFEGFPSFINSKNEILRIKDHFEFEDKWLHSIGMQVERFE